MGHGKVRPELDGLAAGSDGLVQFALVLKCHAEVTVVGGIIRLKLNGLAVAGDGLVQLALVLKCVAEVGVRFCKVLFQLDGLTVGGDGFVQLALVFECDAKVVLHPGVSWPGRQRCPPERNRLVQPWRFYTR